MWIWQILDPSPQWSILWCQYFGCVVFSFLPPPTRSNMLLCSCRTKRQRSAGRSGNKPSAMICTRLLGLHHNLQILFDLVNHLDRLYWLHPTNQQLFSLQINLLTMWLTHYFVQDFRDNFPWPKVTCSNIFCCQTNSLKHNNTLLTIIYAKVKHKVPTTKELEPATFCHVCLKVSKIKL